MSVLANNYYEYIYVYKVEIKPKGILPVKLIEGRIASDLRANLIGIRNAVEKRYQQRRKENFTNALVSSISAGTEYSPGFPPALTPVSGLVRGDGSGSGSSSGNSSGAVDAVKKVSAVMQGIRSGSTASANSNSYVVTQELIFENKQLRQRIEFLESEIFKKDELINNIRKLVK